MEEETVDPGPAISGDSITVEIDNVDKQATWEIGCTRLDGSVPDQPPQSVYKHDGTTFVSSSNDMHRITLDGLLPGYEYTIKVAPKNDPAVTQDFVASTHCCCDCNSIINGDTTGRPMDFEAHQIQGFGE